MRIIRINAQRVGSTSESVMKKYLQPREFGYLSSSEYRTKVPNTQIRFRWTSCRGTMHQTLITDRGRPKNRYPHNLRFLVQNQSVLELWVCNPATNWCVFSWSRHYNFWHIRSYSRYHPPIPQPIPTVTQKPWQICLESPVATTALDCIMKTHICDLFSASIKSIRCMYVLFRFQCILST